MKYIKNISVVALTVGVSAVLALSSCKKDFFEIEDPNGLEDELLWNDEGAMNLFLNRTYSLVMPQWPTLGGIHNTSDELNNANTAFLYGQLTETSVTDIYTGTGLTANRYSDIRRSNIAIEGLNARSPLPESTKNILKGQFFFLRAYSYFKLVRLYGGVPLVLKTQGVDDENLQVPRSKTSECIAAIAKDLDSAAMLLPKTWTGNDIGKVTRAAALAVKGKALLYLASPQFNITNNASRWQEAYTACKAAYDACVADGYILFPTYANLFITEDNKEVLLVRKYNTAKNLGTNLENVTRPFSESVGGSGSNQPTWNLVKAYLKSDGLPTNSTTGVAFSDTTFWLNRDPRFDASIAYNGGIWALSGKSNRRQWTYKGNLDETSNMITGFYCKRFTNPSLSPTQGVYVSDAGGGNGMDWIEMRFAEVILNLAECANEIGNLTEAKDMVRLVRKRAGIIQGTADYGLNVATDIPNMRSLLLNERQIEFALEGMRNYDLRRTRNLSLISARQSYIVTPKSPYFAGLRPTSPPAGNIYLDQPDAFGVKPKDTITTASINNKFIYSNIFLINASVPLSLEGSNVISMPDRYYAYPLPNAFTQVPAIQQTNGWSGGSFNPFD